MYLQDDGSGIPVLRLRLDEPILLSHWSNGFPYSEASQLWKLSTIKQQNWFDHFYKHILTPNYGRATINAAGEQVGGAVTAQANAANRSLFSEWMYSSEDTSLFKKVKLKKFVDLIGETSALFLASDVLCLECDHEEPAWVHYGTDDGYNKWHSNYKFMESVFKGGMFETYLEVSTCIRCDEHKYVTPNMRRYGRHRPGFCECMPCRRGL